jgi:hypothetical protein
MWNASHFLDFYLGDAKGNGVQSYLKVFPNAKYQSASGGDLGSIAKRLFYL